MTSQNSLHKGLLEQSFRQLAGVWLSAIACQHTVQRLQALSFRWKCLNSHIQWCWCNQRRFVKTGGVYIRQVFVDTEMSNGVLLGVGNTCSDSDSESEYGTSIWIKDFFSTSVELCVDEQYIRQGNISCVVHWEMNIFSRFRGWSYYNWISKLDKKNWNWMKMKMKLDIMSIPPATSLTCSSAICSSCVIVGLLVSNNTSLVWMLQT